MGDRIACHLFAEDRAQEAIGTAIIQCVFSDRHTGVDVAVKSASGGFGRMLTELGSYAKIIKRVGGLPDLLVVLIDEDGQGTKNRRDMVTAQLAEHEVPHLVVGIPSPRIEDWYLLDPRSVANALEVEVGQVEALRTALDSKRAVRELVSTANALQLVGDLEVSEFASEIVADTNCPAAVAADKALNMFIDDLGAAAKQLALQASDTP
jgi:hypothetical protein